MAVRRPGLQHASTAIAIALVVSLCSIKPSTWMAWTAALLGYFVLMVYQRYHSPADILTTAVVIAPPLIAGRWWPARNRAGQITGQGRLMLREQRAS